jgi:putative hydrolase of the HAD superfamily
MIGHGTDQTDERLGGTYTMIAINALILDYGNVLCEPQRRSDIEAMAANFAVEPAIFESAYWLFRDQYDRAEFDGSKYWSSVADHAGCTPSKEQMDKALHLDNESWSRPSQETVEWVKQFQTNGTITALLSNMPPDLRHHLDKYCHWLPQFDHSVFSCDLGHSKPRTEIYHHCLSRLKLAPEETLFLDDREPNCEAAKSIGMHAIVFSTLSDAVKQINEQFQFAKIEA